MSEIEEYLKSLEILLDSVPLKLSTTLQTENRGDVALYVKIDIVFNDESELHTKEYFAKVIGLTKVAYSYHYQDDNKELIFRYDNAEHHPEIKTVPYHKHLKDSISPADEIDLKNVLDEILRLLFKGKKQ